MSSQSVPPSPESNSEQKSGEPAGQLAQGKPNPSTLLQAIIEYFNEGELSTLCFELRIDYDRLGSGGKADTAGGADGKEAL